MTTSSSIQHAPPVVVVASKPQRKKNPFVQLLTRDFPLYTKDFGEFVGDKIKGKPTNPAVRVVVAPNELEADVKELVGRFGPRDIGHPENLGKIASFLEGRLRALPGARVAVQPYAFSFETLRQSGVAIAPEYEQTLKALDGHEFKNVVASFGPEQGERLVIVAHYDTDHALPGADDNASGVAGALRLARQLSEKAPMKRVDVVFVPNEERPLGLTPFMGSHVYAASLAALKVPKVKMMALEMLGFYRDEPNSQKMPKVPMVGGAMARHYGDKGNFIAVVTRAGDAKLARHIRQSINEVSAVPAKYLVGPGIMRDVMRSDHSSFWEKDPTFWKTDWSAVMVSDTANFRNDRYHTAGDTPDTLDYPRMAQVVGGLINTVYRLTDQ